MSKYVVENERLNSVYFFSTLKSESPINKRPVITNNF